MQDLVPIRYGRMSASPFAFYRGGAYIMAADLADTPQSGTRVQLCGDAHLANFGGYASAERELIFDLVDFDETLPGPWEWDVKRLAASVAIIGRDNGFKPKRRRAIVRDSVASYRQAIREFAGMSALGVWYARASVSDLEQVMRAAGDPKSNARFEKTVAKGERKDNARAFAKLAVDDRNGDPHIRADPPLIVRVEDLENSAGAARRIKTTASHVLSWSSYRRSLQADRRRLLGRYRFADVARKVVGVGSVGTRCWVALMLGLDADDPLFLQAKEAPHSVLEPFAGPSEFANQGQRVVEGQRLMQAASDIFLGWLSDPMSFDDGKRRDYYIRQLWDSKISAPVTKMPPSDLSLYAQLCAWTLARAHARSGDAIAIASYLGKSAKFDHAVAAFAEAYADQNERDYSALLDAIADGRVYAEREV